MCGGVDGTGPAGHNCDAGLYCTYINLEQDSDRCCRAGTEWDSYKKECGDSGDIICDHTSKGYEDPKCQELSPLAPNVICCPGMEQHGYENENLCVDRSKWIAVY